MTKEEKSATKLIGGRQDDIAKIALSVMLQAHGNHRDIPEGLELELAIEIERYLTKYYLDNHTEDMLEKVKQVSASDIPS